MPLDGVEHRAGHGCNMATLSLRALALCCYCRHAAFLFPVLLPGTYIFALNGSQCVDATRAGNMAHLINHSCAPCCHSRTITVRCAGSNTLVDHVVICASRDIAAGE